MQKGYKRQAKGMAVLRCFIGLFIVLIVVLLASFVISLDYSDKLSPDASVRPYVAETPAPAETPSLSGTVIPAETPVADATPTSTPAPTPTPTPEPTPTPSPTPAPTAIPDSAISEMSGDQDIIRVIPNSSTTSNAQVGITDCYRSEANQNRMMVVRGYAYINDSSFDGSTVQTYIVLKRDSTSARALVRATNTAGISGKNHEGAQCVNPSGADFEFVLSSSMLPDDIYSMGLVLQYTVNGETKLDYIDLPAQQSFTVLNSVFLGDIPLSE